MKKFKLFLLVICSMILSESIHTQTLEPAQVKFNYNGVNQYLSADSSYFQQKEFIIGCHWYNGYKMSSA